MEMFNSQGGAQNRVNSDGDQMKLTPSRHLVVDLAHAVGPTIRREVPIYSEFDESHLTVLIEKIVAGDLCLREQAVYFRIKIETEMAIDATRHIHRDRLVKQLDEVQNKMRQVLTDRHFGKPAQLRCWELDAEFHKLICRYSTRPELEVVIDKVLTLCREVGRPRTYAQAHATVSEHQSILDAIAVGSDSTHIQEAIHHHIRNSELRWFGRSPLPYLRSTAISLATSSIGFATAIAAYTLENASWFYPSA